MLIIGKMFGSEVPGEGISYTQKEYRYAVKHGVPVLAFLIKDDADVAKSFQETEKDRIDKMKAFRKEVETGRTVSYWSNPDELAGQVISSLSRQIYRKPRPGWVRAYKFDIEKSHAELLELTEKVRELELENADLRKIAGEKREPKLKVELYQPVKFEISDPEPVPDCLRKAANEGKKYKVMDTEHEAAELVTDYETRSYIMAGFTWLDFVVKNEGTCKATDVTVEIEVPEGLMVFETVDLGMYTEVTIPRSITGKKTISLNGIRERELWEDFPKGLLSYQDVNGWDVDGKNIEIDTKEIRHLSGKRCSEFFVTASKPGIYKLKCRLMCAEYVDPQFQELTVEVVKAKK